MGLEREQHKRIGALSKELPPARGTGTGHDPRPEVLMVDEPTSGWTPTNWPRCAADPATWAGRRP